MTILYHDFSNLFVFPFSMRQDEEILKGSYAALFSYNGSDIQQCKWQNYGELFI